MAAEVLDNGFDDSLGSPFNLDLSAYGILIAELAAGERLAQGEVIGVAALIGRPKVGGTIDDVEVEERGEGLVDVDERHLFLHAVDFQIDG